jgi:hypothetical protein
MEISPEEKKKIYEEEKVRIESVREEHSGKTRRITSSSLAIAWSIVLLIFFYGFRHYLAYYQIEPVNGVSNWVRYEVLTHDFYIWLPILTITLILSIAGHVFLLIYDRYILRQSITIGLNLLGITTVATLLYIFPFDFSSIPSMDELILSVMLRISIVAVLVILVVVALVNLIKFIIRLATRTAAYGARED